MKKPNDFILQITMSYSDDAVQGLEKRINLQANEADNKTVTFEDYMVECEKAWHTFGYTYGVDAWKAKTAAPVVEEAKEETE